jgi:hypothetical protein
MTRTVDYSAAFLVTGIIVFMEPRVEAQYVVNAPVRNKQESVYRQQFSRSSSTSSESSGQTEFFETDVISNVTASETSSTPFIISDSFSRKASSSQTTFEVNNIFPKGSAASTSETGTGQDGGTQAIDPETGAPIFALQAKDLSNGTISINVLPSKDKVPSTTTSATFNSTLTQSFSLYAESSSPNFVSSFSNVIFNKQYLGR